MKQSSTERLKIDPHRPSELTASQRKRLDEMSDDEIDYSDIPDLVQSGLAAGLYRPMKQVVTIRLDADVVAWFKNHSRRYQTAINGALRQHIAESQHRQDKTAD